MPHNTAVWAIFFLITFGRAILDCSIVFMGSIFKGNALDVVEVVFSFFDICVSVWCLLKLKALPSDEASMPEKAAS